MTKQDYQKQFVNEAAVALAEIWKGTGKTEPVPVAGQPESLAGILEAPRDFRHGWFALPMFKLASSFGLNPPALAKQVSDRLAARLPNAVFICSSAGPYVNVTVRAPRLGESVLKVVLEPNGGFGRSRIGEGRTLLVEYSSPNIAKPFGIGHLRSTVIGQALKGIYTRLGYRVVTINYPGDWGTQFGKMIVACRTWADPANPPRDMRELLDMYVRFHREAESNPSLDDQARQAFKELEQGDAAAVKLWNVLQEISHAEMERIYGILGVNFDLVYGESFLNDKMEPVIERLRKAGLTAESQGALIVPLPDPQLPPALLRRGDGATLYLTRDLAGMVYRWERFAYDKSLYVVGASQADHFRQLFLTARLLDDAEGRPADQRMSLGARHIEFGWVKFGNRAMSTRQGNVVFLEDVIDEAVRRVRQLIVAKNPELADIDTVARQIGVGAVVFAQLSVRRHKDVNFVWDDVLNFEGETGPYLQYTHARLCSLVRHYGKPVRPDMKYQSLDRDEERRVLELLAEYPETLEQAGEVSDPNVLAGYLLRLAGAFNKVYQRKDAAGRIDKIISDDAEISAARMALVKAVQVVVRDGLETLGMAAPEAM